MNNAKCWSLAPLTSGSDMPITQVEVANGVTEKDQCDTEEERGNMLAAAYRCILPRKQSRQSQTL